MDDSAPWKTEETTVGWPRLLVAVSFSFSCILQIWCLSPLLRAETAAIVRETQFVGTNNANMEEAGILEKINLSGSCYLDLNQV